MTPQELNEIVSAGESLRMEFKKSTAEVEAGMRTMCAMLNGVGGYVVFGVTDAKRIVGQEVSDSTLKKLASEQGRIEPAVSLLQETVELPNGKIVLVLGTVTVTSAPYTYGGRAYWRQQSTTSLMPQEEYERRLLERGHPSRRWENLIAEGFRPSDLDIVEIQKLLTDAVAAGRIESTITAPMEALAKLHLISGDTVTQAAVVAFAREPLPHYPQCALRMARFRGVSKAEFLDQRQLTGQAFVLLREADQFLRRHLPIAGRFEPGLFERQDEPLFPPLALREALVNALCHRDYSIPGGAVSVAVFDDRLEITSTGTLPFGLTTDDLKREHLSKPRNPLLAEVFFRRGLIEKWGRGTQRIIDLCVQAGHPAPEFVQQSGDLVVRFLPSGYVPPHQIHHNLTDRQRRILHALRDGNSHSLSEIQSTLPEPIPRQTMRDDLRFLRQVGLVESLGRGRASVWRLVIQAK